MVTGSRGKVTGQSQIMGPNKSRWAHFNVELFHFVLYVVALSEAVNQINATLNKGKMV